MSDEMPTVGELTRVQDQFRADLREGFANINSRLDGLVSEKLYAADHRRLDDRFQALVDAISAEREARIAAIKDEQDEREKVEGRVEKFKMSLRWVAGTVLIPTALFVTDRIQGG